MVLYSTIAVLIVTLLFCINLTIFGNAKLLDKKSIFVISVASIVISIVFPIIVNGFMETSTSSNFNLALLTSVITCLALIVIISLIISSISDSEMANRINTFWEKSMLFQKVVKVDCLQNALANVNTDFVEVKEPELSVQGKNILEKSVDTDKNIDTMGIESFYNESLFTDNIAIQNYDKTNISCSELIDNFSVIPWDSSSNSTENNKSDGSIDDYEVFEDYFEEEVLDEYLHLESEYSSENGQITEKREVALISSICGEVNSDAIAKKESLNKFEDEYLDNSLDIVFNEIILDGQDEMGINFGSDENNSSMIGNDNEVMAMVAANLEDYNGYIEPVCLEMPQEPLAKSVDEIIDEAFALKEKGDFEGAILSFFYALDNAPDDDVVFWIVLDICVLYKQLGQAELAREVLESYLVQYGEFMDKAVRHEIEMNLQ